MSEDDIVDGYMYEAGEPSFSAPVRNIRGVPVVEARGELDLSTVPKLMEAIGRAEARKGDRALVVVDLRDLAFIDSTGAYSIVEQVRATRETGGELRVVVPKRGSTGRVFDLLEIDRIIELYYDLAVLAGESAN